MTKASIGSGAAAKHPPKLLGLEIVRFTCAMAVLVWHYHHFAMVGDGRMMALPHEPLGRLLAPFYGFGKFGVQVFWSISGFIFYWKYADALAARSVTAPRFFWLRFSRLYPLHFVTLLFVAALQPLYASLAGRSFVFETGASPFLLQLFIADQWGGMRAMSFNGPIWSVSAEVFVYVAFFALLRAFGKSPWLIVAAIVAGMGSLLLETISPPLICGAYFFAGGAAAELMGGGRAVACRRWAAAVLVAGLALAPLLDLGASDEKALGVWLLVMVPPLLVLAAQDWTVLDRWHKTIAAAGNLTYSTYLMHFPLQLATAILALALHITLPVGSAWFLIAYLAAAIVIGRVVFLRFEAPAQRLIRAATLARTREPAAA